MQKFGDQRRFVPCLDLRALVPCLWGACVAVTAQPAFPPTGPDILHSPTLSMIDVEFNIDKRQLTWVDMVSGNLWAASYDVRVQGSRHSTRDNQPTLPASA